jgi:SAM-dependent methyltransferase
MELKERVPPSMAAQKHNFHILHCPLEHIDGTKLFKRYFNKLWNEVMTIDSVNEYIERVKAPWGKMFYDLVFIQLNIPQISSMKILDFGSGLGVTSNHFAKWHEVTAIEPNQEMIDNRRKENPYTQIYGGIEKISEYEPETFDFVICHNVLEYIEYREPIIEELLRVLKSTGVLSIIKHNRVGRVHHTAVFKNDPKKALSLLDDNANDNNNYLGTQYIYSNDDVIKWISKYDGEIAKNMGMRAFYALGQDNTIKYTDEWYHNMLTLESRVAEIDEYRSAAFFNHLLIKKSEESIASSRRL